MPIICKFPTSRDQDNAGKALTAFKALVDKYPNSEYVEDPKFKIQVTEDQLAGKEMSIGRFYLNRHNYTAAINRFRNVLQYYQTTRHAKRRSIASSRPIWAWYYERSANRRRGSWSQFPGQPVVPGRLHLLKGKGLSPTRRRIRISKIWHTVVPS